MIKVYKVQYRRRREREKRGWEDHTQMMHEYLAGLGAYQF